MKVAGNGQAKILSASELGLLFADGLKSDRDKALFGICLYTACRVSEAISLFSADIGGGHIIFRKHLTKGKLATREVAIAPPLAKLLVRYHPHGDYYFPGRRGSRTTLSRNSADKLFRAACDAVGIQGASTHSLRRTALTKMHFSGVPLRTIQAISGHHSLDALQRYLEVSDEQKIIAVNLLNFEI